jgi:hypothetical protein
MGIESAEGLLKNHGGPPEPMGLWKLPVKPATQTNAIELSCPRNYWFSAEKLKSRRFCISL